MVRLKNGGSGRRGKAARVGRRVAAWTALFGLLAVGFMTMGGLTL